MSEPLLGIRKDGAWHCEVCGCGGVRGTLYMHSRDCPASVVLDNRERAALLASNPDKG